MATLLSAPWFSLSLDLKQLCLIELEQQLRWISQEVSRGISSGKVKSLMRESWHTYSFNQNTTLQVRLDISQNLCLGGKTLRSIVISKEYSKIQILVLDFIMKQFYCLHIILLIMEMYLLFSGVIFTINQRATLITSISLLSYWTLEVKDFLESKLTLFMQL